MRARLCNDSHGSVSQGVSGRDNKEAAAASSPQSVRKKRPRGFARCELATDKLNGDGFGFFFFSQMRSKARYNLPCWGLVCDRSRGDKAKGGKPLEESLQCSRAVSQQAEEAAQRPLRHKGRPQQRLKALQDCHFNVDSCQDINLYDLYQDQSPPPPPPPPPRSHRSLFICATAEMSHRYSSRLKSNHKQRL